MLFADGTLALFMLGLWIFCLIDVITTPDGAQRNLPKIAWLLIVLLLPDVGSIVWLVAGRPWNTDPAMATKSRGAGVGSPGRAAARPTNPDDDEEFLAGLRARAEEQRRRAREQQDRPPAE